MKIMRRNQEGFTLIELMIVVAIIAVLALIAIPTVTSFIADARQSEVKLALGSFADSAEVKKVAEGGYECGDCGWAPGAGHIYTYELTSDDSFAGKTDYTCAVTATAAQTATTFLAVGSANLDNDATCDEWTINQEKDLRFITDDTDD